MALKMNANSPKQPRPKE